MESRKSDNSEILYQNNYPRALGYGIEDRSNRENDQVNNGPTLMINIDRV